MSVWRAQGQEVPLTQLPVVTITPKNNNNFRQNKDKRQELMGLIIYKSYPLPTEIENL